MIEKVLYTGETHTSGGRNGQSRSSDGRLDIKLSSPIGWQRHQSGAVVCGWLVRLLHRSDGPRGRQAEDRAARGHGHWPVNRGRHA